MVVPTYERKNVQAAAREPRCTAKIAAMRIPCAFLAHQPPSPADRPLAYHPRQPTRCQPQLPVGLEKPPSASIASWTDAKRAAAARPDPGPARPPMAQDTPAWWNAPRSETCVEFPPTEAKFSVASGSLGRVSGHAAQDCGAIAGAGTAQHVRTSRPDSHPGQSRSPPFNCAIKGFITLPGHAQSRTTQVAPTRRRAAALRTSRAATTGSAGRSRGSPRTPRR
jgi:hypothetical protein